MNWYRIIISASRDDYLRSLGATDDIIVYINSKDNKTAQFLTNEFRKNPQLTIQQLQQMNMPQKAQPDWSTEIKMLRIKFPDEMVSWLIPMLRIQRKGALDFNSAAHDYHRFFGSIMVNDDLLNMRDWLRSENPELASYTYEQAIKASEEWHAMVASGGEGLEYQEKNIVYGPEWNNKQFNGWTIQEVRTRNDLLAEGYRMDHCVGDYCEEVKSGVSRIFSLRDPENEPHVTMESNFSGKEAKQIRGKSNSVPKDGYKAMIREWVESGNGMISFTDEDNDLYYEWDKALNNYFKISNLDHVIEGINEVLDKYREGDEYGLKVSSSPYDYLDRIFDTFLEVVSKGDSRHGVTTGNSDSFLAEFAITGGNEYIRILLERLEEAETKYGEKLFEWMADSFESQLKEESFESEGDYEKAKEEEWAEAETEYRREYPVTRWIDEVYKELDRELQRKKGVNISGWYEGNYNKSMEKSITAKKIASSENKLNIPNIEKVSNGFKITGLPEVFPDYRSAIAVALNRNMILPQSKNAVREFLEKNKAPFYSPGELLLEDEIINNLHVVIGDGTGLGGGIPGSGILTGQTKHRAGEVFVQVQSLPASNPNSKGEYVRLMSWVPIDVVSKSANSKKIAQKIYETKTHEEDYTEIGHNLYYSGKEDFEGVDLDEMVWLWIEGVLYVCDSETDHELCVMQKVPQFMGKAEKGELEYDEIHNYICDYVYKGRYERIGKNKKVSVVSPSRGEHRELPSRLVSDLMDQFGNDIILYRFN